MSDYQPLTAIWTNRQAIYRPDGLPVVWNRCLLPLPFVLQLDAGQAAYAAAVRDAAKMWNREAGLELLREVPDLVEARVFIVTGSASAGGAAATTHSGDVVPESATVELRALGGLSEGFFAAAHEFGHVLGLADNNWGTMGPLAAESGPRSRPSRRDHHWKNVPWTRPRAAELEYLRCVYASR